jgi:hypothetical protein
VLLQLLYRSPLFEPDLSAVRPAWRRTKAQRRRTIVVVGIVFCAIVLVFGIGVGVMLFLTRDSASPYRVGQALAQFKMLQAHGRTVAAAGGLPLVGVYTYKTTGSESAHAPGLLTSGSSYPATSAMTIYSKGCGQEWSWQPLSNRYENLVLCRSTNGAIMLQSRFDADQFYGVMDARQFACTSSSNWLPANARARDKLSGSCVNGGNKNSGGMTVAYSGEVVASNSVTVGGRSVPAVHITLNEKFTGDTVGTGSVSMWLDSSTGLLLKETRTETSRSESVIGWVPSTEVFSLDLASLTPRQ